MQTQRRTSWLLTHRLLLIALGSSVALHIVATVGFPVGLDASQQSELVQFNASLQPLSAPDSVSSNVSAQSLSGRRTSGAGKKRIPRSITAPKSEATFAAPENAIAIARDESGVVQDAAAAGLDTGSNVTGVPDAPTTLATLPVAPDIAQVVAEKVPPIVEVPAPVAETMPTIDLPSRVSISYKATTSVADGVAHYKWKRDGEMYSFESTIQASGFFVNMFAGTITQESTGKVVAAGIEPDLFTIRRGDRGVETAEFLRATGQIKLSRGGESRQLPMPPNLQDTQSFLFQLAIEATRLRMPEDRVNILVTNARGLNRYTFKKVGESTLQTNRGPVDTVHLVRETAELRDSYEVWLSPKHHYLPLKLKFYVDRFPAELIATNISSTP